MLAPPSPSDTSYFPALPLYIAAISPRVAYRADLGLVAPDPYLLLTRTLPHVSGLRRRDNLLARAVERAVSNLYRL
jgi:hypothetical protein